MSDDEKKLKAGIAGASSVGDAAKLAGTAGIPNSDNLAETTGLPGAPEAAGLVGAAGLPGVPDAAGLSNVAAAGAADAEEHEAGEGAGKSAKKRAKNLKAKIIGIVVAVIAVAGFGFYQWHETPEFCTAICHTPMDDAYRQTLYANPYESATDKWGNEVEKADAMLASKHGAMGKKCMACHVPAIQEQVTEGLEWIAGNYYNPLSERDLARLVFYRGVGETEFCLNAGCHNITKTGLTNETANMARNPHSWHHTEYACSDCHKAHRASVMICTQCHDDAEVPDGWLTYEESKNLDTQYMSWNEEQFLNAA